MSKPFELPDDDRPSRTQHHYHHSEINVAELVRKVVWIFATVLILGIFLYGCSIGSKPRTFFGTDVTPGSSTLLYLVSLSTLPPAIFIYVVASCLDGMLRSKK